MDEGEGEVYWHCRTYASTTPAQNVTRGMASYFRAVSPCRLKSQGLTIFQDELCITTVGRYITHSVVYCHFFPHSSKATGWLYCQGRARLEAKTFALIRSFGGHIDL